MAPVDRRLPRMFPPGSSPIERLRDRLGGPNVGEVGPVGADRLIDRPTQGRAPLSRRAYAILGSEKSSDYFMVRFREFLF